MQWNLVLAVQNATEEAAEVSTSQGLAGLLLLLVGGYGAYLWLSWIQGILKGNAESTPACFEKSSPPGTRRPVPMIAAAIGSIWIATNLFLLASKLSGEGMQPEDLPAFPSLVMQVVGLPLGVAGFLLLVWGLSGPSYALGSYFKFDRWKDDLLAGAELWLLAMPPTLILGMLASLWKTPDDLHILLQILRSGTEPEVIGLIFVAAAVVAPLVEELLFRVLMLNGLIQHVRLTVSLSVVLTAATFSIAHGVTDALQLFPLALCLSWSSARRESYITVVIAHVLFNSFMLMLTLLMLNGG